MWCGVDVRGSAWRAERWKEQAWREGVARVLAYLRG